MRDWSVDKTIRMIIVSAISIIVILTLMCSCKSGVEVVREVHYEHHHHTDSVLRSDSVISERQTIVKEADSATLSQLGIKLKEGERAIMVLMKELEKVKNQEREVVHDTTYVNDSIPKIVEVERELTWVEKKKMQIGEIVTYLTALLLCVLVVKRLIKKQK